MRRFLYLLLVVGCWLIPAGVFAQVGGVRGTVVDQDFEVPLPGVKVLVSETGQEMATGETGSYYLENIEPGAYTLLFSKAGYARVTKSEVVVSPGQLAEMEVSMPGEYEEMDELVVRDIQLGGASEIGLLNLRMDSSSMMDSIGADQMSRAAVSDAAGALKLVAGATVQDGKYAVIRGLPDRYVSSQMNGVRLPTADVDKRAVQLDQFPAAMIESVQVSKTFTPDQQGDASGGAVNVVLKGLPDGPVLKASVGTEFNAQVWDARNNFLTYKGGGVDYWGTGANDRAVPANGQLGNAVAPSRGDAPFSYSWEVGAGDKYTLDSGIKVGGFANFFYKHDTSYYDGGQQNKYESYVLNGTAQLLPAIEGDSGNNPYLDPAADNFRTELYDKSQSTDEVQWGALGSMGVESEHNRLALLYMLTHVAEDQTTLLEDTRGKAIFDPSNASPTTAPFHRSEALDYKERDTSTLQLSGHHVIPLSEPIDNAYLQLEDPEIDWYAAQSSATQDNPDKRLFGSWWKPERYQTNSSGRVRYTPPTYSYVKPGDNINLGNYQRVWKNIGEDSDQYALNGKLPFQLWNDNKGFMKVGVFNDKVDRSYHQRSYSNEGDTRSYSGLTWDQYWTGSWTEDPLHPLVRSLFDVGYDGHQDVSATYYMVDLPLLSFLDVVGGARFESTALAVDSHPISSQATYFDTASLGWVTLQGSEAEHVKYSQNDVLPSIGIEIRPLEQITLRASYSETVARQTFKELAPVSQSEYFGADVFAGNPDLRMSSLKNYDLRVDYNPYPGGLVSFSWFYKDIKDPIEYIQRQVNFTFTQPVNYPEGTMQGYEAEVRQQLGHLWSPLEGLSLGLNATLIDSEVTLPQDEYDTFVSSVYTPFKTRQMMGAPDYLFNANLTYDLVSFGTQLGMFYNYIGDTLESGESIVISSAKHSPAIYDKAYGTLNFTLSQKLGNRWSLKFKIKNLTNPEIQREYRSVSYLDTGIRSSYTKGIDYSLGVSTTW